MEVKIHDGPYNVIKNWNYTGLVDAMHNGQGKCWTTKVSKFSLTLVKFKTPFFSDNKIILTKK